MAPSCEPSAARRTFNPPLAIWPRDRRFTAVAVALCVLAALAWGCAGAAAAPSVRLHASLHPKIPGRGTTVRLNVRVIPKGEMVPPPLLGASLRYPAGLDVQLSGLGIEACSVATLEVHGPRRCPADSVMGRGTAVAELVIRGVLVRERAKVAIVRGRERNGRLAMMLVAYEEPALSAQIVMPAQLLPARGPFGGLLSIAVPPLSSVPEGPPISITKIELVLGPKGLRYSERRHGRLIHYKPAGIPLPERCPRGGFPFTVSLHFADSSRAGAKTAVPCPPHRLRTRRPS